MSSMLTRPLSGNGLKYNFDVKVDKVLECILSVVYSTSFSEGNGLLPYRGSN